MRYQGLGNVSNHLYRRQWNRQQSGSVSRDSIYPTRQPTFIRGGQATSLPRPLNRVYGILGRDYRSRPGDDYSGNIPREPKCGYFTDNQAAIRAIKSPRQQSGELMLLSLAKRIHESGEMFHINWILAHVGVPGNEAADQAAKEATRWRPTGLAAPARIASDLWFLNSAVKSEIRARSREVWDEKWKADPARRTTHKLTVARCLVFHLRSTHHWLPHRGWRRSCAARQGHFVMGRF